MYLDAHIPKVHWGGPEEVAGFPRQLKGMYNDFKGPVFDKAFPDGHANDTFINEFRRKYYALANYADHQVGRILDYLDERGLTENTHVIFTSDHGTNLYNHGMQEKYNFFDDSWRTPLILRGPSLPKNITQEFAAGVDVSATILAIAQAQRPPGFNGFDLVGALQRGEPPMRIHGVAGSLLQGYAVVASKWKLTYYLDDRRGQLFDRINDPQEMVNLFDDAKHADVKSRLLVALLQWRAALEPVKWLQGHDAKGQVFPNAKYVYEYTMNLTGTEPETGLQADLAGLQFVTDLKAFV